MSRKLDDDKPYSDEDKAYLHGRSLDWKVEVNERRFGKRRKGASRVALLSNDPDVNVADDKPDASIDVPGIVPGEELEQFNSDLVTQVVALPDDALKEELKLRGVIAVGTKEHLQYLLLQKVSELEVKGK